ncbi:MAG: hypothetical protein SFV23_20955 [Planctomycetaceae bacterium]|nr:hypothetical protein [Planctomycetaceae bacterium]
MITDMAQLLTAAVAEFAALHRRVAELETEIAKLRADFSGKRLPSQGDAPETPLLEAVSAPPEMGSETPNNGSHYPLNVVAAPAPRVVPIIPLPRPTGPTGPLARRLEVASSPPPPVSTVPAPPPYEDEQDPQAYQRRPFVKWLPTTDAELPMIEARCKLKAAACRWADERRKLMVQGNDFRVEIEPKDRDLIWQAKQLPDCFLWMSHSTAPNPADSNAWLTLGGCFEVLADAVSLIRRILDEADDSSEYFEKAVDLLAEAQSALRISVTKIEGPPTDHDQARVFGWLKSVAMDRQIFIRRYMRLDDPAEPDRWSDLASRITNFDSTWENGRKKSTNRKKALGRIRYKLSQLPAADAPDCFAAWALVAEDVHTLVAEGLPPSNVELRDLLVDYVDRLPELAQMPKGFQLTIREIDRYLASAPTREDRNGKDTPDEISPHVVEVSNMLAGKAVILIGGDRRAQAAEALEKAFHLSELIWIETRAHESVSGFEPFVARPEVAMVLLAIRWSSHSYGEVQDFCRTYGKPLVRLPGGYNPNQVAAQIHEQCSSRLIEETASPTR